MVTGTVSLMEEMEPGAGQRYILSDLHIERLPPGKIPANIRLRARTAENETLQPGDRVEVRAGLNPPAPPAAPGAFDFQRYAYFRQMGAFGFTYETPRIIGQQAPNSFDGGLERFRESMLARIRQSLSDPSEVSIAIAMVTGERSSIPQSDNEAMQVSGLAHMLSISGMHIGMVVTVIFFASRFLMALVQPLALRYPIKKYAALLALAGAAGYVTVIGLDNIPAMRSLLMAGLALAAVMLDRTPFSMRTVALAATFILLVWPDALWTASFQMSFAAVAALIWFYESTRDMWRRMYADAGIVRKLAVYAFGLCLTSLVAGLATAPFVLFHFQRLSLYGVLANLLAVPVLGFIVMPAVVLVYLLLPFGAEGFVLRIMGWGIDLILDIAHGVSALPNANLYFAAWPLAGIVLLAAGGVTLMLWEGKGKWLALIPFIAAVILITTSRPPDILVSSGGKLIAWKPRGEDGAMTVSSRVHDRFSAESWAQRYGYPPGFKPAVWPKEGAGTGGMMCDESGCRVETEGRKIAFSFSVESLADDCAWADILIAAKPVAKPCAAPLTIDLFDALYNGAYAIWLDGTHENVRDARGDRPWTVTNRR
jgi:competence protein ComEC